MIKFFRKLIKKITKDKNTSKNGPNVTNIKVPIGPFDLQVIYEDKEWLDRIKELNTNDIVIPKRIVDIN